MKKQYLFRVVLMASLASSFSLSALASDTPAADHVKHHPEGGPKAAMGKEPTPEMRKKMADMHQMMADCLKSDKPMSECKKGMMENCPMMKETGHCPMMGEMHDMMGGGHGKTKKDKKASAEENHEEHH